MQSLDWFTPEDREGVQNRVLELARADGRISAGAFTGSTSRDAMDRFSDVDIAFAVTNEADTEPIADEWTALLDRELGVVHHWDLRRGALLYRVFLFQNGLELDIGLIPRDEFGARGPSFRLIFGESAERLSVPPPPADDLIGLGWHHALHARAAIQRGHAWKAEFYISALKDHALALPCIRLGEPFDYARGIDGLPRELTEPYEETLVRSLDPGELRRALSAASALFLGEVAETKPALAERLRPLLRRS